MRKIQVVIGSLLLMSVVGCAAKSPPPPEPSVTRQSATVDLCAKLAHLHELQRQTHTNPGMTDVVKMDALVADLDMKVANMGVVCP